MDVAINYLLLLLNMSMGYVALTYHAHVRVTKFRLALLSLVLVMLFQVVLCLNVGCAGISIVWCACAGWIMAERRHVLEQSRASDDASHASTNGVLSAGTAAMTTKSDPQAWLLHSEHWVIVIDVVAIVYYAIVEPPITTVAHVLAMVLGATLSIGSIRVGEHLSRRGTTTTTEYGSLE
jgi:hypothetical protein